MKKRVYRCEALQHVYQRAAGRGLLFYSELDFLMYLTILGVTAVKYRVRIVSICLMVDHVHLLIESDNFQNLYGFIQECTSRYALEFNRTIGRNGTLWQRPYGMALKRSDKAKRTAIAYVNNNGAEKDLSDRTENYRWNLLRYYGCTNPFSTPQERNSTALNKAITIVRLQHKLNKALSYPLLVKLFSRLGTEEKKLLSDFIVSTYNVLDYDAAISYYGDYGTMIMALNSNTGSEYDIREEFSNLSDNVYPEITAWIQEHYAIQNPRSVLVLPLDKRLEIADELHRLALAPDYQIRKYLHLPLKSSR